VVVAAEVLHLRRHCADAVGYLHVAAVHLGQGVTPRGGSGRATCSSPLTTAGVDRTDVCEGAGTA
jgi:hypothetical protein